MKYLIETIKILIIMALVVVGVGVVQAAWSSPKATPPADNTPAPINVGVIKQEKDGIFGSKGFYSLGTGWFSTTTRASWPPANLTLGINGAVGATQYCDDNGANCKTMTELGGGSTGSVPAGAVMAFNLGSCPSGWTDYSAAAGRNIVGYGSGTGLTPRTTIGQTGGEEKHTMTTTELATHSHALSPNPGAVYSRYRVQFNSGTSYFADGAPGGTSIGNTGGSSPFNVMDPYVVLRYCQKS